MATEPGLAYDPNHMKTMEPRPAFLALLPAQGCRTLSLDAGATLFRTGDRAAAMFVLESGGVRMIRLSPDGHELTVHGARPGETLAEAAVFAETYHCDAVADMPSRVTVIPCDVMRTRLGADPSLARAFSIHLAQQVRDVRARLEIATLKTAEERILAAFRLHAHPDGTVVLDRTIKALALEIGLTHEAAYRALARLVAKGRVTKVGRSRFSLPVARRAQSVTSPRRSARG